MEIYQKIADALDRGEAVALCTIVRSKGSTPRRVGSKMLVYEDGAVEGTIGGGEMESLVIEAAKTALETGQPQNLKYNLTDPARGDPGVCGGTLEFYVEPNYPETTIVVVGGGHVGKAVVHLAKWMGYRVVLTDDREAFCSPEMVPGADEYIYGLMSQLPEKISINPYTYLVLTTRNVMVDVEGLPAILKTQAQYIGVIGSKRRWATTREKLIKAGVADAELDRVISPMGLELNAETPEEIALSILAEIVMLIREGDGTRMGR